MKKLIAISVVFALIAGTAFAVDLGGNVIGTVKLMQGETGSDVTAGGEMNRIRLEGSGEAGDGNFGGWIRAEADGFNGIAWWKPIDQFKLSIGGNPDGVFGKEGVASWMFNQMVSDTGVVSASNAWGGDYVKWPYRMRGAFFGGFGGQGALMTIAPAEVVDINLVIPFIEKDGELAKDVFASSIAQLDFKLDFGNIALTYQGATMAGTDQPTIFGYFGLSAIENLGLDLGVGFTMPNEGGGMNPIFIGLGVKYATDSFGIKFRTVFGLGGDDGNMGTLVELLPYYVISDTLKAFLAAGVNMSMPNGGDTEMDFHVNPYLEVGNEWGPTFYAGFKMWSSDNLETMHWGVPLAIGVSF